MTTQLFPHEKLNAVAVNPSEKMDLEHPIDLEEREAAEELRHVLAIKCHDEQIFLCSDWLLEPRRRSDDAHRELLHQPFLRNA